MKAVMLEVPESLLAERRRKGLDRHDEMWDGVLHMVPPPSGWHQTFGSELFLALAPIAKKHGLVATYETGLFRPRAGELDYRVPDLVFTKPEHRTSRGAEGAELVVEILSPNDESRDKVPFYGELGVKEVFLLDPDTRSIELYLLRGGKLLPAVAANGGSFRSEVLGVTLEVVEGPKLRVRWSGGETLI